MKKFIASYLFVLALASGLTASPVMAAQTKNAALPVQQQQYSANIKTQKYHAPGCKFYFCKDCTKFFKNAKAAQKAGYEPCKVCGG